MTCSACSRFESNTDKGQSITADLAPTLMIRSETIQSCALFDGERLSLVQQGGSNKGSTSSQTILWSCYTPQWYDVGLQCLCLSRVAAHHTATQVRVRNGAQLSACHCFRCLSLRNGSNRFHLFGLPSFHCLL